MSVIIIELSHPSHRVVLSADSLVEGHWSCVISMRGLPGCDAPGTTTLTQPIVATRRHGACLHSRSAEAPVYKRGNDTPPPSSSAMCVSSERRLLGGVRVCPVTQCMGRCGCHSDLMVLVKVLPY